MTERNPEPPAKNDSFELSEIEGVFEGVEGLTPEAKNSILQTLNEKKVSDERKQLYSELRSLTALQSKSEFSETDDNTYHQAIYFINKVNRFTGEHDELLDKGVFFAACHIFAFDSWFYFHAWKDGLRDKVEQTGVSESDILKYCKERLLKYAEENDLPEDHIEELSSVLDSADSFMDRFYPPVQEAVLRPLQEDIRVQLEE